MRAGLVTLLLADRRPAVARGTSRGTKLSELSSPQSTRERLIKPCATGQNGLSRSHNPEVAGSSAAPATHEPALAPRA
jgi:hypothetical protein